MLNEYFHNVCELDLVFNFYKVGPNVSAGCQDWNVCAGLQYCGRDVPCWGDQRDESDQSTEAVADAQQSGMSYQVICSV